LLSGNLEQIFYTAQEEVKYRVRICPQLSGKVRICPYAYGNEEGALGASGYMPDKANDAARV